MKKIVLAAAAVLLLFGMVPGQATARSLWDDRSNWVADRRPTSVGDIVTVVVNERTRTKDQGKTDVSKSNNNSVADGVGIFDFIRAFGFSSKSNMKGDGSTERTHTAQTQITCLVTDILPNGNLIIEGTRDIATHEETLQLQVVGVIRPQDVDSYNQISSDKIANAEIGVRGKGALTRLQKPGILTQILQTIF
ncbi:flagellar L-ring protein precursor FlgH [Aminivibrio pyruvatiphilus]|jgi:flagellar L-ring protein precursor FlgH|uniref:Flagellar L-ring protein FlgH n=1 Tax=Aminivibrio pyruvatiphilus TaxID=1005740 RepID=A0A4R8M2I1_9BACT|nr:flagellar basal body L-ring protein FlgH [Aminivibrio pyruvatiphilus]TDY58367.1 flagellar L-ring protein precursor FlgH [Aminivibrio pyruvatiphilus]